MEELRQEYTLLFNGITDTINQLERTIKQLKSLQQRAEETYVLKAQELEEEASVAQGATATEPAAEE